MCSRYLLILLKNKFVGQNIFFLIFESYTANPIATEEEKDVTKLYSAAELERAYNANINNKRLVEGKLYGLTLDQMIKLTELRDTYPRSLQKLSFEFAV